MGKLRKPSFKPYRVGEFRLGWLVDQFCVVWYVDGQRRRHRLGVTEETSARTELHAFARAHLRLAAEEPSVTIQTLYKQYKKDRETEGKSVKQTTWLWTNLGPVFGPLRPVDINKTVCRDYEQTRRAAGKRPHTVYNELTELRTIVNWAAKQKLIKLDELPTMWVPPMPEPRDRHLTRDEVTKLLDAAELPHVRLFIILAVGTAARKGAILDLTWNRVDFGRGLIHLYNPEKERTAKGRAIVPMNGTVRAALMEAKQGAVTDSVIEWAGAPVGNVKRAVGTALAKAGLKIPGDGAHLLRHTAGVLMAEDGVPIPEIAQYLGHSDLRTTYRTYARYSPEYLKKAASSLELPAVHLRLSDRRSR